MENKMAAVALSYAPRKKRSAWQQRAIRNVLKRWEVERSEDFERVLYNRDSGWLVEFMPRATTLGQYGWDTEYELEVKVDRELYDQTDNTDEYRQALEAFCDTVEDELCEVIGSVQEQSPFSPKEFVAFLLYQRDEIGERQAADALEVTVGTYRGKLGRVRNKIEGAKLTMDLMGKNVVDRGEDEQRPGTFSDFVNVFEADEYPVDAMRRDDIIQVIRNIINVHEHQHGSVGYEAVLDEIQDRMGDEEISHYRARYELERAIKRGDVERDGDVVTVSE